MTAFLWKRAELMHFGANPPIASPWAPSTRTMQSRGRNGAGKRAFLFLRTLLCRGNTRTEPGELSLTTAPHPVPSGNKGCAEGTAAAPIPTG